MTKLPKTLETVREEITKIRFDNPTQEQVRDLYNFNIGFDAGVAAVLASAELKGLVETLEQYKNRLPIHRPITPESSDYEREYGYGKWARIALERWQEWIKE